MTLRKGVTSIWAVLETKDPFDLEEEEIMKPFSGMTFAINLITYSEVLIR